MIEKVLLHLKDPVKKTELVSFAAALDTTFAFHPLPEHIKGQAFMLTGGAGVGKTVIKEIVVPNKIVNLVVK